jgi:ATP-dependent DNA helicase PIF1
VTGFGGGQIITGSHIGNKVLLPQIALHVSSTKWPFVLNRGQFPIRICYAITINKSQGQTLQNVCLYLLHPDFTHGQLYVAISRVTSRNGIRVQIDNLQRNSAVPVVNFPYAGGIQLCQGYLTPTSFL